MEVVCWGRVDDQGPEYVPLNVGKGEDSNGLGKKITVEGLILGRRIGERNKSILPENKAIGTLQNQTQKRLLKR